MSTWLCQTEPMLTPPGERLIASNQPAGISDALAFFFLPFSDETHDGSYIIGGYCLTAAAVRPKDLVLESVAANWDADRLDALLAHLPVCPERMLQKLLRLSAEHFRNQAQT